MTRREPSVGPRLFWSSVGFGLATALALCAEHWYEPPRLAGSLGHRIWLEPDFVCSLASSGLALGIGVWSGRAAIGVGATAAGSPILRGVIWVALTLLLFAGWVHRVFLFTLLIAPTHGFAGLRLVGLWKRWRTEVRWRALR